MLALQLLLIVLNGIEMSLAGLLSERRTALLIVLNGIEMRVVNYFTPSLMAFNRTKWN